MLKNYEVDSISECQLYCLSRNDCKYFVYRHDTKNCNLIDSISRTCDIIYGPPKPNYDDECT